MSLAPFILIGCGGSGVLSVRHVRDEVRARLRMRGIEEMPDAWQFIGIDATLVQSDLAEASTLPVMDYLPLKSGAKVLGDLDKILLSAHPPSMGRGYSELIGWRPNPELFPQDLNVGLTNRAVGRVVGTVALQAPEIRRRIDAALTSCEAGAAKLNELARQMGIPVGGIDVMSTTVLVITSMAGGSGSGISLDVIDLLKKQGGNGIQPILIAYGTDIFERPQSYLSSNNLGYIAELLNAAWSDTRPKSDIFKASATLPANRAPRATFVLGRKNLEGMDLLGSRNVYRSVGITIAGWMTTPSVRQRFQDYVIGNWNQEPTLAGGIGFADSLIRGNVSSFGSATLAVGRKRFRDYARKFILRDLYEHHHRGFKNVARSVFGEDGDRGIDVAIRSKLVEKFLPEVMSSFGLSNSFDAKMGIISDGSALISDALLSMVHIRSFSEKLTVALNAELPGESLKGSEWSSIIHEELAVLKRNALQDAKNTYLARESAWLNELVKRVMKHSNDYLTRLTLPVMIDLSQSVNESVGRVASDFKTSARIAEEKAALWAADANTELADVATNNLMIDSPQVTSAIELISASVGQELKAQLSQLVGQTLEQVIINVMQPLHSAFRRAKDDVDELTDTTRAGEAPLITQWPEKAIVPRSFQPSPIEHLLEDHAEWPITIERLLRTAEPVRPGESTADAVRRGIAAGVDHASEIGRNDLRPLLWTRNNAPLEFVSNAPLAIDLALDLTSLEDRVDRWLGKQGTDLGDYLREGLKAYLNDPMHPDHKVRLNKFRSKFQSALEQAKPFVQVDSVYYATAYRGQDMALGYTVEPIPFQSGHPAHAIAEELVQNTVRDNAQIIDFQDQDRESITISCFFVKPMFAGVMSSMFEQIAQHASGVGGRPNDLRQWLDFKRGRTLDECVPLPANVTRALIRGFIIGRLVGLIKLPTEPEAPVVIAGNGENIEFPAPSYSELTHQLTKLLMSFVLCFLKVPRNRERAFSAYAQMFGLGVVGDGGDLAPHRFAVVGELASYLNEGKTSIAQIDKAKCEGLNLETRVNRAIEYLDTTIVDLQRENAKSFDGSETVNRMVSWREDTTPVREIAYLLIEEHQRVKEALSSYLHKGPSTGNINQ